MSLLKRIKQTLCLHDFEFLNSVVIVKDKESALIYKCRKCGKQQINMQRRV